MNFGTVDDLLDYILGASIVGGGQDEDGYHFYLSSGRTLVVTTIRGHIALAVVDPSNEVVH